MSPGGEGVLKPELGGSRAELSSRGEVEVPQAQLEQGSHDRSIDNSSISLTQR